MAQQRTYTGGQGEWRVAKEFTDQATGLTVQVQAAQGFKTRYSLVVGRTVPDKGFVRYVNPDIKVENAVAHVPHVGMTLARLYDEAAQFVQDEVQEAADREILRMQIRETQRMEREAQLGPKKQQGLSKFVDGSKTEREAGKKARHEQNLSARRAVDAERTRSSKGK